MTPMHQYLYDKSDIVLGKTDELTMSSMRMSVWQQSVLKVTSSVILTRLVRSAGTTYFS